MKIKINFNNIFKYLLVILYTLMISILLEYNICQNFYGTIKFLTSKPNILLFNILISTILFLLIILIFKKAYIFNLQNLLGKNNLFNLQKTINFDIINKSDL